MPRIWLCALPVFRELQALGTQLRHHYLNQAVWKGKYMLPGCVSPPSRGVFFRLVSSRSPPSRASVALLGAVAPSGTIYGRSAVNDKTALMPVPVSVQMGQGIVRGDRRIFA